jgi:hypothetical protein
MRIHETRTHRSNVWKTKMVWLTSWALVAIGLLALASCSRSRETARSQGDQPAVVAIDTATSTAVVQGIDYGTRTLTIRRPDGSIATYKAGKDVVNFDQIHVGDTVNATVIDALAVSIRKSGEQPNLGEGVTVALAPRGSKPGMIVSDTDEVTSKIESVDFANRTIVLEEVAGKPRTIKVSPRVNLADFKQGDDVVVRYTQALALFVEKP